MFEGKCKLSTFIDRSVSELERSKGFVAALMFLPELYASALDPKDHTEIPVHKDVLNDRWKLVCKGYGENDQLIQAFANANRVEMTLSRSDGGSNIDGVVTFHKGGTRFGFSIDFSVPIFPPRLEYSDRSDWIWAKAKVN